MLKHALLLTILASSPPQNQQQPEQAEGCLDAPQMGEVTDPFPDDEEASDSPRGPPEPRRAPLLPWRGALRELEEPDRSGSP
jgi:hypothetical protein